MLCKLEEIKTPDIIFFRSVKPCGITVSKSHYLGGVACFFADKVVSSRLLIPKKPANIRLSQPLNPQKLSNEIKAKTLIPWLTWITLGDIFSKIMAYLFTHPDPNKS